MKTKTTTTMRCESTAAADPSDKAKEQQSDRLPNEKAPQPVPYPNLEDYVPDDYLTTQDLPAYGNNAAAEQDEC